VPTSRCPSADQLEQFLEEQLAEEAREAVSLHVGGCPHCQEALEHLTQEGPESLPSSSTAALRLHFGPPATPPAAPPDPFLARLRQSPPTPAADSYPSGLADSGGSAPAVGPAAPNGLPAIPGYEILGVLSRGGMGVVYKARQVGLNRLVALKMILSGAHAGPRGMARFLAEAEAVARLRHPNIVQIYDIGEVAGSPYFALEYVEWGSLARRLNGDPQPLEPAVRLVETLARAMHVAHQAGIMHRDLKPANILLSSPPPPAPPPQRGEEGKPLLPPLPWVGEGGWGGEGATPKITDFGLAKRLDEQGNGTQTGEVVGTPSYMAPEQAGGKGGLLGPATDVYALGAILYELLTGRPPFKGATPLDTVVQVLHEEPVRPARLRPELPRDVEIICLKCLQKDPRKRYPSAEALAEDLRRFRQGKPIEARPVGAAERTVKWIRRHPLTAALLAAVVVVTALGLVGVTSQWRAAWAARDVAVEERRKARAALYYSRIAQSQLQWRVNDVRGSRHSLQKCVPGEGEEDRRGWEWYYLSGLFHTDLFTLHHGRSGAGGAVAFSPDGKTIASVVGGHPAGEGEAGEVRLWDAATGARREPLPAPGTVHRLAFAPDGRRLALGATDGVVLVWSARDGRPLLQQALHGDLVSGLAFSPDGEWVASSGWDRLVKLWNRRTGEVRATFAGHSRRVSGVAFHPDGKLLASAGWDATVQVWDVAGGPAAKPRPLLGHLGPVYAVAFSPDGRRLASAGSNGNLKIWDVTTWQVVQSVTSNTGAVLGLAFSPDSRYLAYGGGDATVRVWDVESGVERFIFRGHAAAVESVQFSPDGQRLVSASPASPARAEVKVWDLTRNPEYGTFARTRGQREGTVSVRDLLGRARAVPAEQTGPDIEALAFSPQGDRLVSVTVGGRVQTWDAATGVLLGQRSVPMSDELVSPAVLAALSPCGKHLAGPPRGAGKIRGWEASRAVTVWDTSSGAEVASLSGHTQPIFCVRFSDDGKKLVTVACDLKAPAGPHEVKVWDVPAGKLLATLPGSGQILNVALSPDARWLALARRDGGVTLVEWARPRRSVAVAAHKGAVGAVAFSPVPLPAPPGKRPRAPRWLLASAGVEDRTLHLWDLGGLNETPRKPPHSAHPLAAPPYVCDLAFSPDGRRLAGVSREVVKVWDAATGHEVLTLRGAPQRHWDPAFNPRVRFSPDGKRLAATNWDETISVWDAELPPDEAALARHQAARRRAAEARAPLWHLQEAEDCLEHNNPTAARFHLQSLTDAPLPAPLQARKDGLLQQLNRPAEQGK
jgi:eukaryotic-like serine/threonine-protein kinase